MIYTTPRKARFTLEGRVANAAAFRADTADPTRFLYAGLAKPTEWKKTYNVDSISQTSPAVVRVFGHDIKTGDVVRIRDVVGMTEINGFGGVPIVVGSVTANTFQLVGVDSTSFAPYASGGFVDVIQENSFDDPNSSITSSNEVRKSLLALKRIPAADICHVVPKYVWETGEIYSSADNADASLEKKRFYVVNSTGRVYKCLWNSYSAQSSVQPTSTSLQPFTLSDGYTWKYMGTLKPSDRSLFETPDWMPIRSLEVDDGTDQWDVQNAAVGGTIDSIVILKNGSGYQIGDTLEIEGDGFGAVAQITQIQTGNGSITRAKIIDPGQGYSYARVRAISETGEGADFRPRISPIAGNGSDIVKELLGTHLMVRCEITGAGTSGLFPTQCSYRQVVLMKSPKDLNGKLITSDEIGTLMSFTMGSIVGSFQVGQAVTNPSGFMGTIVNVSGSIIKVVGANKTPAVGETLVTSTGSGSILALVEPSIDLSTGSVILVEHRHPTVRGQARTDSIRLILAC